MKTSLGSITAGAVLLLYLHAAPVRADILYVSNNASNSVEKFTSGGVGSVFTSSGVNGPSGPVPVLSGSGAVGAKENSCSQTGRGLTTPRNLVTI